MFDFLKRFRRAEHVGAFERAPGITIDGAFVADALVNVLYGDKVPQRTYTIGHNGRGSLVLAEQEFRDVLMAMVKMAEVLTPGYIAPKLDLPTADLPVIDLPTAVLPPEQQAWSGAAE